MPELETLLVTEKQELEQQVQQLSESIAANEKIKQQTIESLELDHSRLQEIQVRLGYVNGLLGSTCEPTEDVNLRPLRPSWDVLGMAAGILEELDGEELHFRELAERVESLGGVLNGKDPGNTLNARMNRDSRFVRPTRKGYYSLDKFYPNAANVGARRASQS